MLFSVYVFVVILLFTLCGFSDVSYIFVKMGEEKVKVIIFVVFFYGKNRCLCVDEVYEGVFYSVFVIYIIFIFFILF